MIGSASGRGSCALLENDDPLWDQHSGGSGHSGTEWRDADGELAKQFYAALPGKAKSVLDLLMDQPGEQLDADWIAAQLSALDDAEAGNPSRHSAFDPAPRFCAE